MIVCTCHRGSARDTTHDIARVVGQGCGSVDALHGLPHREAAPEIRA